MIDNAYWFAAGPLDFYRAVFFGVLIAAFLHVQGWLLRFIPITVSYVLGR